ncbi:Carboxylic ester hydrolase [Mycena sanguinolenta]|uniref:Carboxylic ester hydrolase n=1 Tax=Mycena sanguinolenta TaxID=230812 RepID=A0A8H6XI26_9AGAR|nr:Carboxylic ester hydrolase [Mycena sanguinolenta]
MAMGRNFFVAAIATIVTSVLVPRVNADFQQACVALVSQLTIPSSTVADSSFVEAGTKLTFPNADPTCLPTQGVTSDICRVVLTIATSNHSSTFMEAWLPSSWTGRFLATGNGGIGGSIQYIDMDYGVSLVVEDFSWHSLLTSAVVGKQIPDDFYGTPHSGSYYLGCSTGGRQGWKMVQDYPDVFDGIVAGSPTLAWDNLMSWAGMFYTMILEAGPDGYPPASSWPAIDAELLKQCDGLDGAVDGIIEDPSLCNVQPDIPICPPGSNNTSSCITSKQAETVRGVFEPLFADGTLMFPGLQYGPGLVALIFEIYSTGQFLYMDNWFRFAVYDPTFNMTALTPDEIVFAWKSNPGDINMWSGDLSQFRNRGGKILHYHGQQDQLITSANSNRYYDLVSQTMQLSHSSLDEFYCFFRISGMQHCAGGSGATFIGNVEYTVASLDPDQNVLTAMVRWIEEEIAPETTTGTAYINQTQALGVDFRRAHCRYPYHNVYIGKDDAKDPASWNCVL